MKSEEQNKQDLNQAQRSSNLNNRVDRAKNIGKTATPMGAMSLFSQIQINDAIFTIAVMAAMLKDVSDLTMIGSLPGIGTALTLCATITIGLFTIMIGGGNAQKKVKGMMTGSTKKLGTLILGSLCEFLFGLNFLPIETLTAVVIYIIILFERKQSAAEQSA